VRKRISRRALLNRGEVERNRPGDSRLSGGQTFKAFPDPGNVILDNRRLFEFDCEYMLNLPRNLTGVLGKNCA
jgi:hypothetical protein